MNNFPLQLLSLFACCLLAIIDAAPNRSERSKCPVDGLMVYVNMTESDRTEYQLSRIGASTLVDCIHRCYDEPRCSSLKYREIEPLSCQLTSFTPVTCYHITLVPAADIKYDSHTLITVECLKCDTSGRANSRGLLTSSESNDEIEPPSSPESLESKPCLEGSECLAPWSQNGTESSLAASQITKASASSTKICDPLSQRCQADVLFTAKELSNSANLDFLDEAINANSAKDCAERCFENCCEMAVYVANEKKCHFTRKTTLPGVLNNGCEEKPSTVYVKQYSDADRVEITCVTCGSASNVSSSRQPSAAVHTTVSASSSAEQRGGESVEAKKPSAAVEEFSSNSDRQPVIASAIDTAAASQNKDSPVEPPRHDSQLMERACIIVFEVDPNFNLAYFQASDHVEASGADHCAYLCYRDACTAAVFSPSSTPGKRGVCERQFSGVEKCNGTLRRDYYYRTTKPVYLQCFRCLPERPHTKPPYEATTLGSEAPLAAPKQEPSPETIARPGIFDTVPETKTPKSPTSATATVQTVVEAGSGKVETGVPGTIAPELGGESKETSAGEEESKEQAPRAESTQVSEAGSGKSPEGSVEEGIKANAATSEKPEVEEGIKLNAATSEKPEVKSGEQAAPAAGDAKPEVEHSKVIEGASTPVAVSEEVQEGGPDAGLAVATGYEAAIQQSGSAPGTAPSPGAAAAESREVASLGPKTGESHEGAAPVSGAPTGHEGAAPVSGAPTGHEGAAPVSGAPTTHEVSAVVPPSVTSGAGEESTHEAGVPEGSAVPHVIVSTSETGAGEAAGTPSTPAPEAGFGAGKEALVSEAKSEKSYEAATLATSTGAGLSVTAETGAEENHEAASLSGKTEGAASLAQAGSGEKASEAGTVGEGHLKSEAGVGPVVSGPAAAPGAEEATPATAEKAFSAVQEGGVTELYGGESTTKTTIGSTAFIMKAPEAEKSSTSREAEIVGSKQAIQQSAGSEKGVLESKEPSLESKSAEEAEKAANVSPAELDTISRGPTEAPTEIAHYTSAAVAPTTSKAEAAAVAAVTSGTGEKSKVISAEESHKPIATSAEESHAQVAATSAKNAAASPFEYRQGCIVTFQADPYSERPVEPLAGFQASTIARTSEVCAGRCYQDGCTGAKYDPNTKECILGYGGKQICNRGKERFFYEAKEIVWIHCTSCRLHRPGDEGINIMIDPSRVKVEESTNVKEVVTAATPTATTVKEAPAEVASKGAETETPKLEVAKPEITSVPEVSEVTEATKGKAPEETTSKSGETTAEARAAESTESKEEATTAAIAEGASSSGLSDSLEKAHEASAAASEVTTVKGSEEEKVLGAAETAAPAAGVVEKKEETPEEQLNIDNVSATVSSEKNEVAIGKEGLLSTTILPGTTLIGHGCVVSFQAGPIATRPAHFTSEFVPRGTMTSVEECAKRCYMEGCTGAKFDPSTHECSVAFGDSQHCDANEEEHHSVEATETLWIRCISCKHEFTESTQGLLVEDTTVANAGPEGSKEEETSTAEGPGKSTSASKSLEIEEKFLSTVNQDATLESTNDTGSAIALEAGRKSVEVEPQTAEEGKGEVLSSTSESSENGISTIKKETVQGKLEPGHDVNATSESAVTSAPAKSTRLPASVSEIKSEESGSGEVQLDTTPIVVVLVAHAGVTPTAQQTAENEKEVTEHPGSLEATTKEPEETELSTDRIVEAGKASVDVSMVTGAAKEGETVGEVAETLRADDTKTTIKPEVLLALTANTPLHVPIDSSEIFGSSVASPGSSTVGSTVEQSTVEPPVKKTGVDEQNKEKDFTAATAGFQHEVEPITVVAQSTGEQVVHSEVTSHPETGSSEAGNTQGTTSSGIASAVASVVANVVSGASKTGTEASHEGVKVSNVAETATAESHVEVESTNAPETATMESHPEVSSNIPESSSTESHEEQTSGIPKTAEGDIHAEGRSDIPQSAIAESHAEDTSSNSPELTAESQTEVTSSNAPELVTVEHHVEVSANIPESATVESHVEASSSNIPEAVTVEEAHAEVTSSIGPEVVTAETRGVEVTSNVVETSSIESHAEITGNVVETSTVEDREHVEQSSIRPEGGSTGGTLFAENAITEEPVVQANVDDNVRKVIQAASESGVAVTDASPVVADATVEANDASVGAEDGSAADSSRIIVGDTATREDEQHEVTKAAVVEGEGVSTLLPMDLTTSGAVFSSESGEIRKDGVHAMEGNSISASSSGESNWPSSSDEHATTEAPVQAVSDLVNILSHNSKIEEVIGRTSEKADRKENEKESFVVDDASVIKDKEEPTSPTVTTVHSQGTLTGVPTQTVAKINSVQEATSGCPGRIEFEVSATGELPKLNVSSEVEVISPADCARKCYEAPDCVLAGFVPRPSGGSTGAVCLLTSDIGICSPEDKFISQHTADIPFIISCLKCSKCHYTINAVTELTRIREAVAVEPVLSIGQCAEVCANRSCAVAQYDHKSNLCSMTSVKNHDECSQEKPIVVDGDEPVLLECVRCST